MLHLLSSRKSEVTNKNGLKITPWQRNQPNFDRLLCQVMPIEARCFSRLHWTKSNFYDTFQIDGVAGAVAYLGRVTAGYLILYTSADMTEIVNLVVDEPVRRNGVGKSLIDYAAGVAAACGSNRLVANVRETNLDGQLFMKKQGFECVRIDHEYYRNLNEDKKWVFEPAYYMMRGSAAAKARMRRSAKR